MADQIKCVVNRDFWVGEKRTHKGTVMYFPVEEALDGIESGALSRIKDEPKEDQTAKRGPGRPPKDN